MTADDAGDLRQQLAALIARGNVRDDQRAISGLVQRLYDLTHINPGEILETACRDAANQRVEGEES